MSAVILLMYTLSPYHLVFFFFNDTATTEIYTLSLHDALPISSAMVTLSRKRRCTRVLTVRRNHVADRKSTRLNSSHTVISYAVFCLKKKKEVGPARSPPGPPAAAARTTSSPLPELRSRSPTST